MAAKSNAHKVFVALPARYGDGLSVLSWALSHFPVDNTKIIITHVMISPFKASPRASFDPKPWLIEKENMVLHLNKYISHCAIYKFRAEKLVHVADNIADVIVQVISQYGTKNLVMRSSVNSGMTDLASETAKKVIQKAHLSCKLWFVTGGNLIFTREVYSYKLTSASISIPEERPHWNRRSTEASSSTFGTSNTNIREEGNIGVDALLNKIANEATRGANSFEQIAEEMDILLANEVVTAKNQEIREVKEILQREKKEMDQCKQDIEELKYNKCLSRDFEQFKINNEHLRSSRDESLNQIQVIEEGGHEKKFHLTFNVPSEEQLRKAYACCLSIMGVLYISSANIAFCSDSPLSYKVGDNTEWTYYKVVIPLDHVKKAYPSVSQENEGEKYIQLVCM